MCVGLTVRHNELSGSLSSVHLRQQQWSRAIKYIRTELHSQYLLVGHFYPFVVFTEEKQKKCQRSYPLMSLDILQSTLTFLLKRAEK